MSMSARPTVLVCIRALAFLMVLISMLLISARIVFWMFRTESFGGGLKLVLRDPWSNLENELIWAIPLIACAAGLWYFQQPLARLIAPRLTGCPECGYSLRGIKGTQCPECGSEIAPIRKA